GDGETRGAIGDHRLADDVFEQLARAAQVRAELGRRLPVDQAMPVTVAGNLVARRVDGADQARLTVRDPAEDEKRGADTSIFKGIENLVRSNFDTRLERIPLRAIHAALECRDVVVILH